MIMQSAIKLKYLKVHLNLNTVNIKNKGETSNNELQEISRIQFLINAILILIYFNGLSMSLILFYEKYSLAY